MSGLDPFWSAVDASLDEIESTKPVTSKGVTVILNKYAAPSSGNAFFPGSGGDRTLADALQNAGWLLSPIDWPYHYTARHPGRPGESLEYVEGDVYCYPRP